MVVIWKKGIAIRLNRAPDWSFNLHHDEEIK